MSEPREWLYKMVGRWEEQSRKDSRDDFPYQSTLDEVLFHGELRFRDYIQFRGEGEFSTRLKRWLENANDDHQRRALFKLLRLLTFVDRGQMLSLYRDAYRRIITTWLHGGQISSTELLDPDYELNTISLLREYQIFSITESFSFPDFQHINDLRGLTKPKALGEKKDNVQPQDFNQSAKGAIILEDFVGTGQQASSVVARARELAPSSWNILFVPLIALQRGVQKLEEVLCPLSVEVNPAMIIANTACISRTPAENEPPEFNPIRTLIEKTSARVLERDGPDDDPPTNPFGYKGCGAFIVTCHNAPNNSLPLIHHRGPQWNALFRRIHHSKDHL